MAQQTINVGTAPNDGTGTPLRTAFQYTNSNFSELYTAVGPSGNNIVVPGNATITGDLTVDTSTLKVDSANNRVGIGTASPSAALDVNATQVKLTNQTAADCSVLIGPDTPSATRSGRIGFITSSTEKNWFIANNWNVQGVFEITQSTAAGGSTMSSNPTFRINNNSDFLFLDGAGGTRMTLNSTGLGVGASPAANSSLTVYRANSNSALRVTNGPSANNVGITLESLGGNVVLNNGNGPLEVSVGGSLRATIDTSGNVGIGVTPNTWTSYKALQVQGASIFSTTGNDTAYGSNFYYDGAYRFRSASSDKACMYSQFAGQHQWHYTASAGTAGNVATFTQAMTLDASGFLRLAASNASSAGSYWFQVKNTGASSNAVWLENLSGNDRGIIVLKHDQATGATSGTMAVFQNGGGSTVGSITSTNTATAYNIASDYRLKESVKTLSGGIARISALKPSIYKWKSDGSNGEGFLAHELAEVVPLAVTGEKDAVNEDGTIKPQQVDLSKVVPVLVAAIQELTARVQTLETR